MMNTIISRTSTFVSEHGTEFFISLECIESYSFAETLDNLISDYERLLRNNGLGNQSEVYTRLFVNDISDRIKDIQSYFSHRDKPIFYFISAQPPATGGKLSIIAYHIKTDHKIHKKKNPEDYVSVSLGRYKHVWVKSCPRPKGSAYEQTMDMFHVLSDKLKRHHARLEEDVVKTSIFINDIDKNYKSMVSARKKHFDSIGLRHDTNYIASTGVGGEQEYLRTKVQMDAYAILGLKRGQIQYMNAPEYMCPADKYGVTFERGTKITFGDRIHYHISGTASINENGETLFPGDVKKQLERAFQNISALLSKYGSNMDELALAMVYLRNPSDYHLISNILEERLHHVPHVVVHAPICRPNWLIEVDALSISVKQDGRYEAFFPLV